MDFFVRESIYSCNHYLVIYKGRKDRGRGCLKTSQCRCNSKEREMKTRKDIFFLLPSSSSIDFSFTNYYFTITIFKGRKENYLKTSRYKSKEREMKTKRNTFFLLLLLLLWWISRSRIDYSCNSCHYRNI